MKNSSKIPSFFPFSSEVLIEFFPGQFSEKDFRFASLFLFDILDQKEIAK